MKLPRWSEPILALLLGVGLALAVAGPDLGELGSRLWGWENDDGVQAVYLHHQFHDAILAGRLSLHDPDTMVPVGQYRAINDGGNSFEFMLSGVVRLFLGFPGWFNAAALAWIPLNLLAFLPLGKTLWGRLGPTLAAGAAWAVMGPVLVHLGAGRHTQAALIGVPLAVAGMIRLADQGPRAVLLTGVGMGLTAGAYWFYGIELALLAPLFAVHIGWKRGREGLVDLAKAAGVTLAVAAPFALPLVLSNLAIDLPSGNPAPSGQDLTDALLLVRDRREDQLTGWMPWVLLPGFALSLWKGERRGLWAALVVAVILLGLGPQQTIDETRWLLPAYPIFKLPLLRHMLHPSRFLVGGAVFFIIAAADGLARWIPWATWILPIGVLTQDYVAGPLPQGTWRMGPPDLWEAVDAYAGEGIIVLPMMQSPSTVGFQPFHGRRMLGGMTENLPWTWHPDYTRVFEDSALLSTLDRWSKGTDLALPVYQQDLDALDALGIDTLVLDNKSLSRLPPFISQAVPVERRLEEALGAPVWHSGSGAIWRLPETGLPGTPPEVEGTMALPDVPPDAGYGRPKLPPAQGQGDPGPAPQAGPPPQRPPR